MAMLNNQMVMSITCTLVDSVCCGHCKSRLRFGNDVALIWLDLGMHREIVQPDSYMDQWL